MGSGRWSPASFHSAVASRAASGADTFAYSAAAISSGNLRVHQTLDPKGMGIRESRDGPDHPASNAVIIALDVTGSMGAVCRAIHADLPRLHEMLLGHKFIADPQILFMAVGDATCDAVPLQVGQFESDNRMDQNLENMILEGGGGGQKTESYELNLYVAARHTAIDCWEKRRRKGYLFIIGDEKAYGAVNRKEVQALIGTGPQSDVPLDAIIAEARQRYHVYFVIPGGASNGADQEVIGFWHRHLGASHVLRLESPDETSEQIAQAIGENERRLAKGEGPADGHASNGDGSATGGILGAIGRVARSILPGGADADHADVDKDRARRL